MERKTAFISGASRGIGEAIAITLSKEYNVIINYAHSEEGARAVLAQCDPEGHHKMIQCDISNGEQVKAMLEEIVKEYGHLDVVVNNAGITKDNLLLRMSDADFDDVIRVNLKGTYNCIRHVASVVGLCGNMGQANYAASKGGVIALTKSCAKELASRGIRVNAVAPGFIATAMTDKLADSVKESALASIPMKKFGAVQDVANVVKFLCSEDSTYITGQVIAVDGGMVM